MSKKKRYEDEDEESHQLFRIFIDFEGYNIDVFDILRIEEDVEPDSEFEEGVGYYIVIRLKSYPSEIKIKYQGFEQRNKRMNDLKFVLQEKGIFFENV